MGSSSYDREPYGSSSFDSWGASSMSKTKLSAKTLDSSMEPNGKRIRSSAKTPLIIMLDVTGSNINFARLIYDKFPMFYGEIEKHGYLKDFDICICAIGDERSHDEFPLQVSDFSKGIEIDSWLEKLVLEGNGGGNYHESYELAAHYLLNNVDYEPDAHPLIFFIGDEMAYETVSISDAQKIGIPIQDKYDPFPLLNQKFGNRVYMMLNKYGGHSFLDEVTEFWKKEMPPEHVIKITEEKAIVDLMLGIIAIEAKRSLRTYTSDMLGRGQTQERIAGVTSSLQELSNSMALQNIGDFNADLPMTRTLTPNKGKRI